MQEGKIHSYKSLIVWQRAMDLVVAIYKLLENFPKNEIYGLVPQMKRSAVSIPSNIAEGRRRGSRKDYRQFLLFAYSSGAELETQIEIAKRLNPNYAIEPWNLTQDIDSSELSESLGIPPWVFLRFLQAHLSQFLAFRFTCLLHNPG